MKKKQLFSLRILPCDCGVGGHCMCKEMPVILVDRVVDKTKKKMEKMEGRGGGVAQGVAAPPPPKKLSLWKCNATFVLLLRFWKKAVLSMQLQKMYPNLATSIAFLGQPNTSYVGPLKAMMHYALYIGIIKHQLLANNIGITRLFHSHVCKLDEILWTFFFTRKSRRSLQRFTVPSLDWPSATRKISDHGTQTHDLQIHLPRADLWLFQKVWIVPYSSSEYILQVNILPILCIIV
jgi:hypothetical protein